MSERFVIVRCRDAGVHAGIYQSHKDREVVLTQARRLWEWQVPKGASQFLSGVAIDGLDYAGSKIGCPIAVTVLDACEIIECSAKAAESIKAAPVSTRVA